MITDALLRAVAWLVELLLSWLPTAPPPQWLQDGVAGVGTVLSQIGLLDPWLPVALLLQVLGAVLACVLIGLTIKVVRSLASYFLAGGGSSG